MSMALARIQSLSDHRRPVNALSFSSSPILAALTVSAAGTHLYQGRASDDDLAFVALRCGDILAGLQAVAEHGREQHKQRQGPMESNVRPFSFFRIARLVLVRAQMLQTTHAGDQPPGDPLIVTCDVYCLCTQL